MAILVTGGAGFIGSHFVLDWLAQHDEVVINFDKLTYAASLHHFDHLREDPRYVFCQGDIADHVKMQSLLLHYKPTSVVHFAAESHVDRSISGPVDFIQTNIVGTFYLLEAVKAYWLTLAPSAREAFRFLQVSTDEVYGSLHMTDAPFTEAHRYEPNSPYSASKAASDHLVRAYHHTYGLPVLTTNCSNNYGPHQFPEKLIPRMIQLALSKQDLTLYGDGLQIRDWLYVNDHTHAIAHVLAHGQAGETYNIGGMAEKSNLDIVRTLCFLLDELSPRTDGKSYTAQITFVADRPGHDRRYAMDITKIHQTLGWWPRTTFDVGIRQTVAWYLRQWQTQLVECLVEN